MPTRFSQRKKKNGSTSWQKWSSPQPYAQVQTCDCTRIVQRIGLLQEVDYSMCLYTQPFVISQAFKYYSNQCIYYIFLQLTMGRLSTFGQRSLASGPTGLCFTWFALNILCDHNLVVNSLLWPLWHQFGWFLDYFNHSTCSCSRSECYVMRRG